MANRKTGRHENSLTILECILLLFSFPILRKGAANEGLAPVEVFFCWRDAAAARERPKEDRRGEE